jgi:hypothetical protein
MRKGRFKYPYPYRQQPGSNGENKPDKGLERATWALFGATVGLVMATVFLYFVTKDIFKDAEHQTKFIEKRDSISHIEWMASDSNTKRSISIAETSSDAIQLSNKLNDSIARFNRMTTKMELRAYVNILFDSIQQDTIKKVIFIPVTNSGKTPAYYIRNINFFYIGKEIDGQLWEVGDMDDLDSIIKYLTADKEGVPHFGYLPERATFSILSAIGGRVLGIGQTERRSVPISDFVIQFYTHKEVIKKRRPFYLYQCTIYDDIFGVTHRTNYCAFWDGKKWALHSRHNNSD